MGHRERDAASALAGRRRGRRDGNPAGFGEQGVGAALRVVHEVVGRADGGVAGEGEFSRGGDVD